MKFDLHIHSIESKYKESHGIVDASTVENLDLLLKKLNEHKVELISITDHNRFNIELYEAIDRRIMENDAGYLKGVVAGIEFDVVLEDDMRKCHIITIFDTKNKKENYLKIVSGIKNNGLLKEKDEAYTKAEFEKILKDIGLDVILIACQRSGLNNSMGKPRNSFSESTQNPEELILTGYINALEFQSPKVEGILKNNLQKIPEHIGLVMGSDCHDWSEYPYHDKKQKNIKFIHSQANILPTFKGLLMAFTSPKTRINCQENSNIDYINSFQINGETILLKNGINVIVGENGAGKSTILSTLAGEKMRKENGIKQLVKNSQLSCESQDYINKIFFVSQGDIVDRFNKGTLFSVEESYKKVDHEAFEKAYKQYAEDLKKYFRQNIKNKAQKESLSEKDLQYNNFADIQYYYIGVTGYDELSQINNLHKDPETKMNKIIEELKLLKMQEYFKQYSVEFDKILERLDVIYKEIELKSREVEFEQRVKNIIIKEVKAYETNINNKRSSEEQKKISFQHKRDGFTKNIVNVIKNDINGNSFPLAPKAVLGMSINPSNGFQFTAEAKYNNKCVLEEFLEIVFSNGYSDIKKLQNIETDKEVITAVRNSAKDSEINEVYRQYDKNVKKFLNDMTQCTFGIVDDKGKSTIGNTLGELSLTYLKYVIQNESDRCIFLLDQPEDHISNNNISKNLIQYINQIRYEKQIIMVTHNPLLVVNQDVDQVIFVNKKDNRIIVRAGCLEFEDKDWNILDLVANHMDGGKESIKKRLSVYA